MILKSASTPAMAASFRNFALHPGASGVIDPAR